MGDQWLTVCVCVCVFIKLHITAQPGPVKLIFQCYSNGSALWGISGLCVCVCVCVCVSTAVFAQYSLAHIMRLLRVDSRCCSQQRGGKMSSFPCIKLK